LKVDALGWLAELPLMKQHYESFGDRLPAGLWTELAALEKRLLAARV
jgi:phosphoenolpyruvate carboxykinase (GTP)